MFENVQTGPQYEDARRTVVSDTQMRGIQHQLQQQENQNRQGFASLMKAATDEEWISSTALRHESFDEDLNFTWTDDNITRYVAPFKDDKALQDYVMDARSEEEAQFRVRNAERTRENRNMLASHGWQGVTATLLAAMSDPVEWGAFLAAEAAVTAGTAGLGTVPVALAKGGQMLKRGFNIVDGAADGARGYRAMRNARAARAAVLGGAQSAGFEAIRAKYSPDITSKDVMYAALFGGAMGGGVGAMQAAFRRSADIRALELLAQSGQEITEAQKARFGYVWDDVFMPEVPPRGPNEIIATRLDANGNPVVDPSGVQTGAPNLGAPNPNSSTAVGGNNPSGRAATSQYNTPIGLDDLDALERTARQRGSNVLSLGLRGWFSSVAKSMSSDVGAVRSLGQRLGLNATGNRDGSRVVFSASEYQSKFQAMFRGRQFRAINQPRREWLKANRGMSEADFNIEVTRALRNPSYTTDPKVRAAADAIRPLFKQMADEAAFYKVRGAGSTVANYVPRILDNKAVARLVKKHGAEEVVNMVAKAIGRAQANINPALLSKISKGYVDGIMERASKSAGQNNVNRMVSLEDELLSLELGLQRAGLNPNEIQDAMDVVTGLMKPNTKRTGKANGNARTRHRIELDESTEHRYIDANGDEQVIRFDDMLNNDIDELMTMYTHQMGGSIGLARNGIELDGGETFENMMNRIRRYGMDKGHNMDKLERELQALQYMYDSIKGTFVHKADGYATEAGRRRFRQIREFNYIRSMGAAAYSAIVEVGSVVGEYGVRAFIKKVPEFRSIIKKAVDGTLDDAVLKDIEAFTGLGTDMLTGRARDRYDEVSDLFDQRYGSSDYVLGKGREFVGKFSGLGPVTVGLRRLSAKMFAEAWGKSLKNGRPVFSKIKMEQLGLDDAMTQRIMGQLQQHATFNGNKLESLNLDKWAATPEGREAREAFTDAMFRDSNNIIQETNLGNTSPFMRSEVGKTLFQFMSFVLGSAEQQTQRLAVRAVNGDVRQVAKVFLATTAMGSLSYTAKVYSASMTMDPKEGLAYREKMLTPARIMTGSLSMLGSLGIYSSLIQRMFAGGSIVGNPTVDLIEKGGKATNSIMDAIATGDEMTDKEWRNIFSLMPLYTLHGVRQIADGIAAKLGD